MSSAVYLYISISMSSAHSPSFPSFHLSHSSFSNPSLSLPSHSSFWFSKLSVTSPTSQLILHPFRCFPYVTAHSPALLSLLLRHRLFHLRHWRTAHDQPTFNIFRENDASFCLLYSQYNVKCFHSIIIGLDGNCCHMTVELLSSWPQSDSRSDRFLCRGFSRIFPQL